MRLVSASSILEALGISQQAGSLAVAEKALDAITPRFEQVLERRFTEATVTDYFDLLPGMGIRKGITLRLTYGGVAGVVVRYTPDGTLPADAVNGVLASTTEYIYDSVGGTLTLLITPPYGYRGLSVAYSVGYEVNPSTKLPIIPDWLAQAATQAATAALQANPANIAKDKTRFISDSGLPDLRGIYRSLLAPHFRPRAGMILPAVSEAVDA